VVDPGEQEEQRVAPELEEAAPSVVRDGQEGYEAIPDRLRQLLCTDLSVLGESFGELGKSGDVHEGDGAFDQSMPRFWVFFHPVDDEPRQIRRQEMAMIAGGFGRDSDDLAGLIRVSPTACRGFRRRRDARTIELPRRPSPSVQPRESSFTGRQIRKRARI
jgi:hypothetical protein